MLALTRSISDSFVAALAAVPPDPPIDVVRARAQHAAYRAALAALGARVLVLDADEAHPDGCFVEDTAVIAGGVALITRPGAPSRQGEGGAVARALAPYVELADMPAPATLDGGDCLLLGRTLYVGRSARTNAAGVARAAAVFGPRGVRVVAVELPADVLHLKCVCARLDDDRVLVAEGALPAEVFVGAAVVWAPRAETYAANVVTIGAGAIVADGFPGTRAALEGAGFAVHPVATTEVRKADGSLTCLSVLVPGVA
ncbi:MAG: dimethylargininase [Myxococcales bacterium]|nr:dimethylargininase [Myxococcales bacterium]